MKTKVLLAVLAVAMLLVVGVPARADSILIGNLSDCANFAVLYEGNGNHQLNINTNQDVLAASVKGNVGIGDPNPLTSTPQLDVTHPGILQGNALFAGAVNNNSNGVINGTVTGYNTNVQTDLDNLNALSSALKLESGTSLIVNINNNQSKTVNVSDGVLDASGRRVFTVTSFNFGGGSTLTINGDTAHEAVVFNFDSNVQFKGTIVLNGLTSDEVLFNVTGGSNLAGGDTLQDNTNKNVLYGIFLDPNGAMSINDTTLEGRFFGGDTSNMQIVSGGYIEAPPAAVPIPSAAGAGFVLLGLLGTARWFKSNSRS